MITLISLTFCGSNLLNRGTRRHEAEILTVNFVKVRRIGEIVQIHIRGHYFTEIHSSFFEIIQKITHGLPDLMAGGGGVDAAVWPGDEATLGRAI